MPGVVETRLGAGMVSMGQNLTNPLFSMVRPEGLEPPAY
jgi:hypothetical protein